MTARSSGSSYQARVRRFFRRSDFVDHLVLRPLWHIKGGWELSWDEHNDQFKVEDNSYAELLNELIGELAAADPPRRYHDNEDRLAEYVNARLNWGIRKEGRRWVGADYESILEQGGFADIDQRDLVFAAAGRIRAALDRGQEKFDDMEISHQRMLAAVLSIILYHRE